MAYIYLLNLYEKIDVHMDETKALMSEENKTPHEIRFLEGRMEIISEFKQFLSKNLDRKLPKRIRNRLLKSESG